MLSSLGGAAVLVGSSALAVLGLWSIILDLRVMYRLGGAALAVVGLILLPVTIFFAPLSEGIRHSNWLPAAIGALGSYPALPGEESLPPAAVMIG